MERVSLMALVLLHGGDARRPELSTEFFLVPEGPSPRPPAACANCSGGGAGGVLREEAWAVPLLVVAALSMALMGAFEVFVLCKARRTSPSRRHLFLGQTLLLGLFLCALVGALPAATPTPASCGAVRLGAGVAYALVMGALLVKSVFLVSLNGGVYLPAAYQALLLAFAVLVQVAVGLQWLLQAPPAVDLRPVHVGGVSPLVTVRWEPTCRVPYSHLLLSLLYCGALLLVVALLAVKTRGIRDNYREATFIGLAAGLSLLVAVAALLGAVLLPRRHRDACLAFGLEVTAAVVFLVMFMPKGRQLAAMGRDGVYAEDREERLSSLSRAASPSFFHFTPAPPPPPLKPGASVAGRPSRARAVATSALYKGTHVARCRLLADQVALVTAPPSYTRMYHYYPYCYYPRYPGACPCAPAPQPPASVDHVARDFRWKSKESPLSSSSHSSLAPSRFNDVPLNVTNLHFVHSHAFALLHFNCCIISGINSFLLSMNHFL